MNHTLVVTNPEHNFPEGFLQLFSDANVADPYEGLVILFHTFMLEVGFIPKDVDKSEIYECMPENWRSGGIFNLLYYHKSIPETYCRVTYVPLYTNLAIHGLIESDQTEESNVYLKIKVNTTGNISDPYSLFPCPEELSINFKDGFCFPLLVLLQQNVDYKPLFGLSGLIDEAKFVILKLLPVKSVVSMSAVNKDFHIQANSSYLWKSLFFRDYGADNLDAVPSSSEENWKEMYKVEYLKRKRKPKLFRPRYTPYYMPEIFPMRSDFDTGVDLRIDMDPALQQAFPLMRSRFRPTYFFHPGGSGLPYNGWFF